MAIRRAGAGLPGNGDAMIAGAMPMAPRPGMMGRANNAPAGQPGPQSGAAGGAMGGPVPPPVPPPMQPQGGGPTAPLNVQGSGMLQNRMGQTPGQQGQGPAQPPMPGSPNPLPAWGGNSGGVQRRSGSGMPGEPSEQAGSDPLEAMAAHAGTGDPLNPDPNQPQQPGAMSPLVMLRMLKSMGRV